MKKYKKIVLAGGNGYLGGVFAAYYKNLAEEIIILSRKPAIINENIRTVIWDAQIEGNWTECLENSDLLINLCGKNVNCRYTQKNREEILQSRIIPTTLLGNAIKKLNDPPKLWINIASATIYRHAEDHAQDEESGETGYGFSVDVCRQWEDAFFNTDTPETRKIVLRMGVVLGRADGAFPRLFNLVKFGLGGMQGTGEQYFTWIHEQDAARCTEWLIQHAEINGVLNCTAPGPLKNKMLMKTLRNTYGTPFGLPSPAWLLEAGALIIGTETELLLKSRWVVPARLLAGGFNFQFPAIDHAIHDLVSIRK